MNISVCVISYNQQRFLAEALDSVLAQTLRPAEIIVVDDGSGDGSQALIAARAAAHPGLIKPVLLEQNVGVAAARNLALQNASGELVTFLDADDRYLPAKLDQETRALTANAGVDFVFGNVNYVDEAGSLLCRWVEAGRPPEGDVFLEVFARRFPRGNLYRSEMVRTASWRAVGGYDPALGLYEDFDMRIRLANRLRCAYVDQPLSDYRLHGGGLSRTHSQRHYEAFRHIFAKNLPLLEARGAVPCREVTARTRQLLASHSARAARQSIARGQLLTAAAQAGRACGHLLGW